MSQYPCDVMGSKNYLKTFLLKAPLSSKLSPLSSSLSGHLFSPKIFFSLELFSIRG
jgi:hypothetical protein